MIRRRPVLLTGAALAAGPVNAALPIPPARSLAFRLVRHGSEIGRHVVAFDGDGSGLTVTVAVDALVSLLSIPIVRYSLRVTETWQGSLLVGLSGKTDKNGQHEWMSASRTGEGLVVLGSRTQRYVAPEAALGTTSWNKQVLDGPMISLEDGVLLRPRVTLHRGETIRVAAGTRILADHYTLSGAFDVDLWYDRSDAWAGLEYTAGDGSEVRYERM